MITKVPVGRLNKVAYLLKLKTIVDDDGFNTDEWEKARTLRCRVEFDDRLQREKLIQGGQDSIAIKIFTFRYFKGLTTKDMILFNGAKYEIYAFTDVEGDKKMYKVWGRAVCN